MARRLVVSERAGREIGEAYEWYEAQLAGLGTRFLETLDILFSTVRETPELWAEIMPGVRRAFLARFPYSVFYATRGEIISILAVVHTSRNPRRWPRR